MIIFAVRFANWGMESSGRMVKRRIVRSYVTSVISISLVLVLVAAAAVLGANARGLAKYFKENMEVSVILKESVGEEEGRLLSEKLSKEPYVKDSRYVSKEEGEEEMKALLGEDFLSVFETSPVPTSIDLRLEGDAITTDSLGVIKAFLMENQSIEEVVYQESLVDVLNANINKISVILGVVILLLLVISFALIGNTVRLNIYARRFTIHTMSLVGAKRSFIARPFVLRAVVQGAVAGVMASAALMLVITYFSKGRTSLLAGILDINAVWAVLAGTVVLGVLICVVSTLFVVNKLVYISKDNLYY